MARIKVTGYIDTEDLLHGDVDLAHEMGVSNDFYEAIVSGTRSLPPLDDIEFDIVPDDEGKEDPFLAVHDLLAGGGAEKAEGALT